MDGDGIKHIVEAALLTADEPVSVDRLVKLFGNGELPPEKPRQAVREALGAIGREIHGRGYELVQVASGFRFQIRQELSPWVGRLFEQRPPRYSRALLETLALIVYRQPVTRGEVEDVRGVSVAPSIMRALLDRGWIRAVGKREAPGRPTMYGTTPAFLDYFNLKSLNELPPLADVKAFVEPLLTTADEDQPPPPPPELPEPGPAPVTEVARAPTSDN